MQNENPNGSFNPSFPWLEGIEEKTLSTTRGFVFQFPPFPALPQWVSSHPKAGLYVHIPFCPYHCAFCYYSVLLNHRPQDIDQYLNTLELEMDVVARPHLLRHELRTIFIGGGTPTVLSAEQLDRLIRSIRERFDLQNIEEFTVESDPTTLSAEKIDALRSHGVNRMSIGIQSFSNEINRLNSRGHSADESFRAFETARGSGMKNINLDLICGLIGETPDSWTRTIDTLLELAPEHTTIYLLSLRPQTEIFARMKRDDQTPAPPGDEERIAMYLYARTRLLDAGYVQTTPNCFVRSPEFEQRHQRAAWDSLPLIGLGNSAYSFVDDCVTQNHRSVATYKKAVSDGCSPVEIGKRLNAKELMVRYSVLRLKQLRIARADFENRFGLDVMEVLGTEIKHLSGLGLLEITDAAVSLTTSGIVYVDDVCRSLYTRPVRDHLAHIESTQTTPLRKSLV